MIDNDFFDNECCIILFGNDLLHNINSDNKW